jgi:hypothetical protein
MKNNAIRVVAGLVALLLVVEVCLRVFFGLGSPALVYASSKFGYAFQPNQAHKRFGHRVSYNEASLRSEPLRPLTDSAYRVLCVGGSLTNGGAPVDQADTYPYQLERVLREKGQNVQALNASASGWTLANEYNFLQDKGIFGTRIVVLEVGTRELYQGPDLSSFVGSDPNLPDHNPPAAIVEVVDRYILPRILRRLGAATVEAQTVWTDNSLTEQNYQRGLATLKEMVALVSRLGAKPILLLTPDRDESIPGHYRVEHRMDLNQIAADANSRMVDMMPLWHAQLSEGRELFRDMVDPTPDGNRLLADTVAAAILQ